MRKKKKSQEEGDRSEDHQHESCDNDVCSNCIHLLQENSQLKEQLDVLLGRVKRKQYTIAPTLYTFYRNNVQKNRVSRYGICYIIRL